MSVLTGRGRALAVGCVFAVVLGVTACGRSADTAVPGAQGQTTASATAEPSVHNEADVEFAQGMIGHHEGAIEMADLAIQQASGDDVRALAERISAAQGPEIEQMRAWLEAWGEDTSAHGDMDGAGHGGTDAGAAMAELEELSGTAFDSAFLELMIEHHGGAVEMAQTELDDGADPAATRLARTIIDDQTAEIAEMEQMLASR